MLKLKWHKLGDKKKKYLSQAKNSALILGSGFVQRERFNKILTDLQSEKRELIIIGLLEEEFIPGFENSLQFQTLKKEKTLNYLEEIDERIAQKVLLLEYSHRFTKYLVKELNSSKILAFNGSWKNIIHYQDFWWEAYENGVKIETVSPFQNEEFAREYSEKIKLNNLEWLENKWKDSIGYSFLGDEEESFKKVSVKKKFPKLKNEDLMKFCDDVGKLSWDWTGQTGCCLVRDGEILEYGYNKVLPYAGAMFHKGSVREKRHAPIGENLELGETVHAEINAILKMSSKGKKLEAVDLWVNKFCCPYCARAVASSHIKRIFYKDEYINDLSYEVINSSGKEVVKVS